MNLPDTAVFVWRCQLCWLKAPCTKCSKYWFCLICSLSFSIANTIFFSCNQLWLFNFSFPFNFCEIWCFVLSGHSHLQPQSKTCLLWITFACCSDDYFPIWFNFTGYCSSVGLRLRLSSSKTNEECRSLHATM